MPTLDEAATAAGLKDPDLVKLAKPGLHADAAIADLKKRYPAAFPATPKYRDMTLAQRAAFDKEHKVRVTRNGR